MHLPKQGIWYPVHATPKCRMYARRTECSSVLRVDVPSDDGWETADAGARQRAINEYARIRAADQIEALQVMDEVASAMRMVV